ASTRWWGECWSWPSSGWRRPPPAASPSRLDPPSLPGGSAAAREVLGRHVVEEVLELLDDLLLVLDLVLELDRGLRDHVLVGEDRRAGADGQGEGIGGAGVDLDLAPVQLEGDRGVERVLTQLGHRHARTGDLELGQH